MTISFSPQTILVPLDVEHLEDAAFEYAVSIAKQTGGKVVLAYAAEAPGHEQGAGFAVETPEQIKERLQPALEKFLHEHQAQDIVSAATLRIGDPADAIVEMAQDCHADLIVMLPHRRKGLQRLFKSSVTARVVEKAPCAVLCVPSGAVADAG